MLIAKLSFFFNQLQFTVDRFVRTFEITGKFRFCRRKFFFCCCCRTGNILGSETRRGSNKLKHVQAKVFQETPSFLSEPQKPF